MSAGGYGYGGLGGGEVVTIQLGRSSNFVGSHFWNIQDTLARESVAEEGSFVHDEIEFESLMQEREVGNEVVKTPRLLLYDLKGSLGGLRKDPYANPSQAAASTWKGPVERHESTIYHKNTYLAELEKVRSSGGGSNQEASASLPKRKDYGLESVVEYWTDFRQMEYHPRSFFELTNYVEGLHPFNSFADGRQILRGNSEEAEEIRNHARKLLESCDRLTGIQLLADSDTSFSGFCCDYLELLREDFLSSKDSILLYAVSELDSERRRLQQLSLGGAGGDIGVLQKKLGAETTLNRSLLFTNTMELVDLMVPLFWTSDSASACASNWKKSLPRLVPNLIYHSSALLACALDSLSVPWRRKSGRGATDFQSFLRSVGYSSAKIASVSFSFEALQQLSPSSRTSLQQIIRSRFSAASSAVPLHASGLTNNLVEGLRNRADVPPFTETSILRGMGDARNVADFEAELESWMCGRIRKNAHCLREALPLPISFPNLFAKGSNDDTEAEPKDRVAMLTHLQVTPALHGPLSMLVKDFEGILPEEHGMQKDEFRDIKEKLLDLADNYEVDEPLEV